MIIAEGPCAFATAVGNTWRCRRLCVRDSSLLNTYYVPCAMLSASRVLGLFFSSQQPPEAGTIIISIVQVRKPRHGEVRLLPRGVPAEPGFELIAWVCWQGRQGSPCSCLE